MLMKTIEAKDYCSFVTDGTHDSPKPQTEGRYLVTSKHLNRFQLDFQSAYFISEEDFQKIIARSSVEQWDILFSMIGTIGNIYIETNPTVEYACKNMGIFKMGGDSQKAKWLFYYLQSPKAKEYIAGVARGTTQGYVPLGALRTLPIEVPSDDERKKIVQVLWNLDKKILINQTINKNLLQQLRFIFSHWFTDNPQIESIRQIPLNEVCTIVTKGTTPTTLGKKFVPKGINFIKAESILDNHSIDKNKFAFIDTETNDLLKRSILKDGDIVFTIAGTLGRFALIDSSVLPANTNQAVAIIRANRNLVEPEYLYSFFVGNWHNDYYTKRIQQAVQANLSLGTIKSLPIPILSKAAMNNYLETIGPIIRMTKDNEIETTQLKNIRDTLLPKLMSGELDVSNLDL